MEITRHEYGYSMRLVLGENERLYDAVMVVLNTLFERCLPVLPDREPLVIHKEEGCGLYWMRVNSANNRRVLDAFAAAFNGFLFTYYPWVRNPRIHLPDMTGYEDGQFRGVTRFPTPSPEEVVGAPQRPPRPEDKHE